VFVGGCTFEAAETICNAEGDLTFQVMDAIAALIGKSLLRREESAVGEPRLVMLETIREYALERLALRSDVEVLRRWHANYYLTLVEQSERAFRGPQARSSMDRIDAEYGNVCATLLWSQAGPGRAALGLRVAGALLWYWDQRSWAEGVKWLTSILHHPEANAKTAARAKALIAASFFAHGQNDLGNALALGQEALMVAQELGDQRLIAWALLQMGDISISTWRDTPANLTLLEESLSLFRTIDESFGIARTLFVLGYAKFRQGDVPDSIALLEECQVLYRELGDKSGAADPLWVLGLVALERAEAARAVALFEESLTLCQDAGDRWGVANTLGLLGIAESQRGRLERAKLLLEESAARWRDQEDRSSLALTLNCLADVAQLRGDHAEAVAYYDESLTLYEELRATHEVAMIHCSRGYLASQQSDNSQVAALLAQDLILCRDCAFQDGIASCLIGLGLIALARVHPARATRLFSAAVQELPSRAARLLGAAYLAPLQIACILREPFERSTFERNLAATRAQLGDATFAAAWADGRAMTLDQAIAYALESTGLAAE
jgi:tetratricopeptide (TPR) repeat protein